MPTHHSMYTEWDKVKYCIIPVSFHDGIRWCEKKNYWRTYMLRSCLCGLTIYKTFHLGICHRTVKIQSGLSMVCYTSHTYYAAIVEEIIKVNTNQMLNSLEASPSWVSYEVSIMSTWENINVIWHDVTVSLAAVPCTLSAVGKNPIFLEQWHWW